MNPNVQFINRSERCYGCGSCAMRCPQHCIYMESDAEGFDYPRIDFDQCTRCNRCMGNCPVNDAAFHARPDMTPKYFRAKPLAERLRQLTAVNALFVALSDAVLRRGGSICGAVPEENFRMAHRIVADRAGRDRMIGFHYLQSRVTQVYTKIRQHLNSGKLLLFVGSPCKVAGLNAYLGHNCENLITLEYFCEGKVSPLIFDGYLDALETQYHSRPVAIKLCDPATDRTGSELEITFADGETRLISRDQDPLVRLFRERLAQRPCCGNCPYAGVERGADISIAEFPGEPGIALAAVNTNQGYELLSEIFDDFELHNCRPDDFELARLTTPHATHPDRRAFLKAFRRRGFAAAARSFGRPRPWYRKLRKGLAHFWMALAGRSRS
ncbi:MAG: Coenzyme F420 hydrogenase/dehydrogenase, beta subunit C-terminal domain [Victivallaceae bacterium]